MSYHPATPQNDKETQDPPVARIAVTGAAGLIGGQLVDLLLSEGHEVLGIDNLSLGQPAPTPAEGYAFQKVDVRDRGSIHAFFDRFKPDQLVHLAAIHHIPTCDSDPPAALHVNVVGTQIVLDAARMLGCERAVLASTGAVYDWSEHPLKESVSPTRAADVYSVSKLANEHQAAVWQQKTGRLAVVARLFNTVGPNDRNGHLVPELLAQLRRNGSSDGCKVLVGNVEPRRDYVSVYDVAAALKRMLEVQLDAGLHVFNVGTGVEYGVADVVQTLASILGLTYRLEVDQSRVRRVDRLHQCADIGLATQVLAWRPQHNLEATLRRTIGVE
jgi:UDP-glucose 4-epimerase